MDKNRPFDLKKLDFEARRKQRRKKLLLFSSPVIVVMLVLSAWLSLPTLLTMQAQDAFVKAEYKSAVSYLSPLSFANSIEPYKALYNQGTALAAEGKYDAAAPTLEAALAYAAKDSEKCMITFNLVLTIEGAADAAVIRSDVNAAVTNYRKALNTLQLSQECFEDPALQQRIEKNLAAAEEAQKRSGSSGSSNDQSEDGEATASQQEQLKKMQSDSAQYRKEGQFEKFDSTQLPLDVKPW